MKYCKGCCSREGCIVVIHIKYTLEERGLILDDCPCSMCLIKVVCRESCDDYTNFRMGEPVTGSIKRFK